MRSEEQHPRLIGAGIVPFFRDDYGEPHFVFARERAEKYWRASNKLSSFGGAAKPGETAVQNAVRELREESLHAFATQSMEVDLVHGIFALKIVIERRHRSLSPYHVTYVKEVAPSYLWHTRFQAVRQQQLRMTAMLQEWASLFGMLATAAAPFLLPQLEEGFVELRFAGPVMYMQQVTGVVAAPEAECDVRRVAPMVLHRYVRWCVLGQGLHYYSTTLARACPGLVNGGGFELDDAYLEIDSVLCYSYTELCKIRDRLPSVFRYEFLPIVRALLHEFRPQ